MRATIPDTEDDSGEADHACPSQQFSNRELPDDFRADLRELLTALRADLCDLRESIERRTKPLLTVEEVADLVGRAAYTVRRWVTEGRLAAVRVNGSGAHGRLLIPRGELKKLMDHGLGANLPPEIGTSVVNPDNHTN